MRLNDRVRHWIASWTGEERQAVTIQDLLEHCSGLPGHGRYFESPSRPRGVRAGNLRGAARVRAAHASIYSDPGFMLLGFAMENAAGAPLDRQFDEWRERELGADVELRYRPGASGSSAQRRRRTRRLARSGAARCTTRTPRRSAASPRTRDCSAPPPRSARARAGGCARPSLPLFASEDRGARQLARARLGHDAADLVVRHEAVAGGDRSHRLHRDVAVDRSRAGSLCGGAVQPRASDARRRWHPGRAPRVTRRDRY